MAYSLTGLTQLRRLKSNLTQWSYVSADTLGTILGVGYFDSAAALMRVGDQIFAVGNSSPTMFAVTVNTGSAVTIAQISTALGAEPSDGDKGDVVVSGSGLTWTIDNDAVTYAKMQNVSATDKVLGRSTAGAGDTEEITCTAFGRSLIDDADAAAGRTTLAAAALASPTFTGTPAAPTAAPGTNTTQLATTAFVGAAVTAGTPYATAAEVRTGTEAAKSVSPLTLTPRECICIPVGDETSNHSVGTAKVTFRMPYAFKVSAVRASCTTAPTGATLIFDINEAGASILSTKLSIDISEKTSTTAASAAVISDADLADDAEITVDIDQVGSTITGAGGKVYLIGNRV